MFNLDWKSFVVPLLLVLGRNLTGWGLKALEDGKIEPYEVRELLKTSVKIMALSVAASFGFVYGIGQTAAAVTFLDLIKREISEELKGKSK